MWLNIMIPNLWPHLPTGRSHLPKFQFLSHTLYQLPQSQSKAIEHLAHLLLILLCLRSDRLFNHSIQLFEIDIEILRAKHLLLALKWMLKCYCMRLPNLRCLIVGLRYLRSDCRLWSRKVSHSLCALRFIGESNHAVLHILQLLLLARKLQSLKY